MAFGLFFSSSSLGLKGVIDEVKQGVENLARHPRSPYSQRPLPAKKGAKPSRDPIYRGGKWNNRTLADLYRIETERLLRKAPTEFFASLVQEPGGGPGGTGAPGGGEGGTGSGGSGSGGGAPEAGGAGGAGGTGGVTNTNTGNKLSTYGIVGWESRGPNLGLTLYHNSFGSYIGDWGHHWSSTFDAEVNYTAGSSAIVRLADGTNNAFTESAGVFTPPVGVHDSLVHNSGGTWTLTSKQGGKFEFNASGKLTAIKDRNLNTITVNRNTSGQITTVTDATGRSLTYAYNTAGYVSSVTDPLSRVWSFGYDSFGDLTSITYPAISGSTASRTFTYNGGHAILTDTDPRGKTWTWTYDTSARQTSFTTPLSQTTTFSYTTSAFTSTSPLGKTTTCEHCG
jgi:YD repeat-containing protein